MRIDSAGHAVFASTLIALGVSSLVQGDFAAIWQPMPKALPAREALVLLSALVLLATGIGLVWSRTAALAAQILLAWLLLWLFLVKGRVVLLAPTVAVSWESAGETAVLVAGAGALYARFAANEIAMRLARAVYGLALIAFGVAHLAYVQETASLVPGWLPSPVAWVYFTGGTYVAGGLAVLAGLFAWLAVTLSAVQIGLFTLLVWLPPLAAGSKDAGVWSEAVISWALTAAAWVVAESYRGRRA
jgi:uncharacterized membrane protein